MLERPSNPYWASYEEAIEEARVKIAQDVLESIGYTATRGNSQPPDEDNVRSNAASAFQFFTDKLDEVSGQLIYTAPRKTTALLDSIYLGLSKMREAHHSRKALLIISDGGDNSSRYTQNEVKSLVKEADTLIYAIGIFSRYLPTVEERFGPTLLSEIAEATGGRSFSVESSDDLPDVAAKIGLELRNQYLIGYRPTSPALDGKWRKIRVKVLPPKGLPPLQVYAKKGYYASSP